MEIKILGSGGKYPTPSLFCKCEQCQKALRNDKSYQRNTACIYIKESNILVDCPEDLRNSIIKNNIKDIDNVFITHADPSTAFGLRLLLDSYYDVISCKTLKRINVYIPNKVYEKLKTMFPMLKYHLSFKKKGDLIIIEDGDIIEKSNIKIKVIGYNGNDSDDYAYLFESKDKKMLYAPSHTKTFVKYRKHKFLDLLIHECPVYNKKECELQDETDEVELIHKLKIIKPKTTILTHIESYEIHLNEKNYLEKLEKKYKDLEIKSAYDTMKIKL